MKAHALLGTALVALTAGCGQSEQRGWARAVSIDALVTEAHPFDLNGRGVRFEPTGTGYAVTVLESVEVAAPADTAVSTYTLFRASLPFEFPFGGARWTAVTAGANGELTFGAQGFTTWPLEELWPTGSMQDAAAALMRRQFFQEHIIAVLWGLYDVPRLTVESSPEQVRFTWRAERRTPDVVAFEPLGTNVFQAVLFPSGAIELRYPDVPELDGVVGIFHALPLPSDAAPAVSLSKGGPFTGHIHEVFRYPTFPARQDQILQRIAGQVEATDEFIILLTDFRFDLVFGGLSAWSTAVPPIEGLGQTRQAVDFGIEGFSSEFLQLVVHPMWLGQPTFRELVADSRRPYERHAFAVGLFAHELTHRWGVDPDFGFVDSATGARHSLVNESEGCHCHWSTGLHAPAVRSVSAEYTPRPYAESSPMGGNVYAAEAPGVFTRKERPYFGPAGFSALDLYLMGAIDPEDVPDTFILEDTKFIDATRIKATQVPVRIADVIAAMGPRVPSAATAQRTFRTGVYVLHRGAAPDPAALERAEAVMDDVAAYFDTATGSKVQLVRSAGR